MLLLIELRLAPSFRTRITTYCCSLAQATSGKNGEQCRNMARGGEAGLAGFHRLRCDRCRLGEVRCQKLEATARELDEVQWARVEAAEARAEATGRGPSSAKPVPLFAARTLNGAG